MTLNKLDNFIKNTEGRILYVSPSDLDSTDSITNQGNSLAQPFKTLQRAIIEAARFSYLRGNSNDEVEKTTILLMPGQHTVDNRPGFALENIGGTATVTSPSGTQSAALDTLSLTLNSNFDLTQEDNILYKFNSIHGGVIVPRGTSIVGLDLRKTKIRPKYVPNPTDSNVANSAIFRITGACYFWQFSIFDGSEQGTVYTDPTNFSVNNQSFPSFSHHKLTCFEYADGVNKYKTTGLTDLDMYYGKLSNAFNVGSGRDIDDKYPANPDGFAKQRPEWEIVGAFANDPIKIYKIEAGSGGVPTTQVTVKTAVPHELTAGTPIKISGVSPEDYNISTKVQGVSPSDPTVFTYLLPSFRVNLPTGNFVNASIAFVTIDTDTVSGASPYIFNISLRSVWGMNGMLADGSKASGFRSMVVAQFTAVSLQKDDRAFVKYNKPNRNYNDNIAISKVAGATLSTQSSSLGTVYHSDPLSIYRSGWETSHIKATNDAFIQIVSVFAIGFNKHLDSETGGDMSITNSNSNFGQIALNSSGFKKEAFEKDNKAFITSIITPRAIITEESNLDWQALDAAKTISVANNARLYLFGFNSKEIAPPVQTQGYRVGARVSDKLYITGSGTEYSANILMSDGVTSSVKEYSVSSISGTIFNLGSNHTIGNGEKVIIISDDGDLPENIVENTVYYAITTGLTASQIKLASSQSSSAIGDAITVYGGTSLKILSRVSDKVSGDVGHPIQFDIANNQWYITTNATSGIYTAITGSLIPIDSGRTEPTRIKRIEDTRSLDEKVYKIRVVIPKELQNGKNPENSFVIQETSSTGYRDNNDPNLSTITSSDYNYNRNLSLIAKCTRASSTVTIISELPHNLHTGDSVIIKNVTDSTNTSGEDNLGYNGTFVVTVSDDLTFTYTTSTTPGSPFTNNTTSRTILSPRFERNNLQSNLYIYRKEVISSYIEGVRDGIYHFYVLSSDKAVPEEFTNIKYSQNVVDFYPQLDRDNINDNPASAKSFAKRSPLGEVVTNDLKKSITRESTDTLLSKLGVGLDISGVSGSTITFARRHGLSGIVAYNTLTGAAGYTDGTYQNVKLLNDSQTGNWRGATAKVVVSGGAITAADIVSSGSGYSAGGLYFDSTVVGNGNGNARFNITASEITPVIGNVVQFTGAGTVSDTYHRITAVSADNTIGIAKTAGDTVITANHYAVVLGPSILISSTSHSSGITTFNCSGSHGLFGGNKFRVIDASNNNLGDYIVKDRVGVNTFTALTPNISATSGYILKHGLSSNEASSDSSAENLGTRSVSFFDNETLTLAAVLSPDDITIQVSSSVGSILKRFPLGSYIQIDEEILRIVSSTLSGASSNEITVIRGSLGTRNVAHDNGSLIKKIKPIAVEFRRPSILRASGHTFEYLGYGPGNYSTALPQVQSITLTEREEFLVQSQERSGGIVVYTGMNNNGDSFVGNRKTSSATGEEITYDAPIPTITGEDPSRLSVVFDEVTIKERLVVEGGNSGTILSQFDGPVTFNKEVKFNGPVSIKSQKISDDTDSISPTTGALVVPGGVGIGKRLNVGGALQVNGSITGNLIGNVNSTGVSTFSGGLVGNVTGNLTGNVIGTATNANNINISNTTSSDTTTSIVLVANQATGNQSPFIDSGLSYNADTNALTATTFIGNITASNITGNVTGNVTGNLTGNVIGTATNANNINISNTTSSDTTTSIVLVANQETGNQSPFIDSGLSYNANTNGLTIGGTLDVTGNTTLTGNLTVTAPSTISGYGTIPIGGIIMWSGTIAAAQALTGWALCNGSNSTPDLRNRFVVGAHSGAGIGTISTAGPGFDADNGTLSSNYTPGNTGGETAHQISLPELASHSHGLTNIIGDTGGITAGSTGSAHQMNNNDDKTTDATGDGKFHENRPPYYALAFIMRIS